MPITIRDVALQAGVSRGTVSRVLNDSPRVDPLTRAKVLETIRDLDYVPSQAARQLMIGRTMNVGVIVPFLTRPSVVERLRGVESALEGSSYDLVVYNTETVERRDRVLRDAARRQRVDGLVVVSLRPHDSEVERVRAAELPLILVDAHHRLLPRVVIDDVEGGRLAARHLLELGHRRIGFIGDLPRNPFHFVSSRLRFRGVQSATADAGVSIDPDLVATGAHSVEAARDLAGALLAHPQRPTALVLASDTQALGALEAARHRGLRVPEDLSIIGYDDIEVAGYVGLTTVRQPLFESGHRGAVLLLEALGGRPVPPVRETLSVELIVRATTGPAGSP